MATFFVSCDSKDRNIAAIVVETLRRQNPKKKFFWTGDSLLGGKGWFDRVERALVRSKGIICLITNNPSGTNNWINFELGAAIGGKKHRMIIVAPGISTPLELSRPLQELQYTAWSDRVSLKKELKRAKLAASKDAVEGLVKAFEPQKIISCVYGVDGKDHTYSDVDRGRLINTLENLKELVVGNHLIGNKDPNPGYPKNLRIEIKRAGETYFRTVEEGAVLRRGDLW